MMSRKFGMKCQNQHMKFATLNITLAVEQKHAWTRKDKEVFVQVSFHKRDNKNIASVVVVIVVWWQQ